MIMKSQRRNYYHRSVTNTIVFAVLLILAGVSFLGFNLGFFPMPYKNVIFSWPMLVIAWGLLSLSKKHIWSGGLLVLIGGFFLIPNIIAACPGVLPVGNGNFVHLYWPVLLIAAGVLFLVRRLLPCSHGHCLDNHFEYTKYKEVGEETVNSKTWKKGKGYFDKQSVFSSGKHIVLDPEFKGGDINTVFGDTTLDLRKTTLPEGDTILEINIVLGSVTILVPTDWTVEIKMDSVLYNFEDKRFETGQTDNSRRLIIHGSGVLGSGELRN